MGKKKKTNRRALSAGWADMSARCSCQSPVMKGAKMLQESPPKNSRKPNAACHKASWYKDADGLPEHAPGGTGGRGGGLSYQGPTLQATVLGFWFWFVFSFLPGVPPVFTRFSGSSRGVPSTQNHFPPDLLLAGSSSSLRSGLTRHLSRPPSVTFTLSLPLRYFLPIDMSPDTVVPATPVPMASIGQSYSGSRAVTVLKLRGDRWKQWRQMDLPPVRAQ